MWPPRCPNLNLRDLYLWGHLKSVVYNPMPKTLDDLKVNLERELKKISKDILKSVFLNFGERCDLIKSACDSHIEVK